MFFALLELFAAFNGALLGLILLARGNGAALRPRLTLAAFLLLAAAQLTAFVAIDRLWLSYNALLGIGLDVAGLATFALLLDYVRASLQLPARSFFYYAPIALYLGACALNRGRLGEPGDFTLVVAAQVAYSAAAFVAYLGARASRPAAWAKRPEQRHLPVLLVGVALLHLGQILAIVAPGNSALFEVAPLVGAAGLLTMCVYVLVGSPTLRHLAPARGPEDLGLGARLDALIADQKLFLDQDLNLAKLASLLDVQPAQLSAHLNGTRGLSFRAFINGLRVEEAKRLLRAPEEARSSVDAIAQLAGFRSRSSFYTAFQSIAGMSPQDYRNASAASD